MDEEAEYSSMNIYCTPPPPLTKNESTALIKNENGTNYRPFVLSLILITLLIAGMVTTALLYKQPKNISLQNDHEYIDENLNADDCRSDIDCNSNGICSSVTGQCRCDIGYTTYDSKDGTQCNYKQKFQMNAFLLSLFLGEFGAGRYYVGDYVLGTIKLLLIFLGCGVCCSAMMSAARTDSVAIIVCGYLTLFCSVCSLGIWCIVDIILFATNSIPDQNGVDLAPW